MSPLCNISLLYFNYDNVFDRMEGTAIMRKYVIVSALFFILLLVGGCSHNNGTYSNSAIDYIDPHQGPVASDIVANKLQRNASARPHIPPVPEPTATDKVIQNGMLGISIIRVLATPFTLPLP